MDLTVLHLQNFGGVSYLAFGMVLVSFYLEMKSNTPYKSLLLSNIGFGIYNFTVLNSSEIDFPIYFIFLSFLVCSWFFILKNIEEEENEDRGFLRNDYSFSMDGFSNLPVEKHNSMRTLEKGSFPWVISKLYENKGIVYVRSFFINDTIHYRHPQRKFVQMFTYFILIAILAAFLYV